MPPPARSKRGTAPPRARVAPLDTRESDESNTAPSRGPVVAILNDGWRVVEERVQSTVQRRQRRKWASRRFCTTRSVLLRDVRELCGDVSDEALELLEALPDRHPGLVAYEKANMAKGKRPARRSPGCGSSPAPKVRRPHDRYVLQHPRHGSAKSGRQPKVTSYLPWQRSFR